MVIFITLLSNLIKLIFIRRASQTSADIGIYFGKTIYKKAICQDYLSYTKSSTNEVVSLLVEQLNRAVGWINQLLLFISAVFSTTLLLITLLSINVISTLIILGFLATFYISISYKFKSKLSSNEKKIIKANILLLRMLKESFGSIKNIILDSSQNKLSDLFLKISQAHKYKTAQNRFIVLFPRQIIETISLITLSSVGIILYQTLDDVDSIPAILGSIAFGIQKLIPYIQTLYASWASCKSKSLSIQNIIIYLEINKNNNYSLFKRDIYKPRIKFKNLLLENVTFNYPGKKTNLIKNINLNIQAGEKIIIVGKSGSGKSTLIDIMMSLIKPTSGKIKLNGKDFYLNSKESEITKHNWMQIISHVQQDVFIFEGSIEENIIFHDENKIIDKKRFEIATKVAELDKFVSPLKFKYKTLVGEDGRLLSGGQRQRIALARAIYKNPDILFLDEATNAIDFETEQFIFNNFSKYLPNITIIMITHRLTSFDRFNKIYTLKSNKLFLKK